MRAYCNGLGFAALLLAASVAYGQQHRVNVDDGGKVIAAHEHMHAKSGHTITWRRSTGSSKPWFVRFTDSPCAEGNEFGSDGAKVCHINVVCKAQGDAGCRAYPYQSATGRAAQMNDPDVIVDP
jgi:hypothetical protein